MTHPTHTDTMPPHTHAIHTHTPTLPFCVDTHTHTMSLNLDDWVFSYLIRSAVSATLPLSFRSRERITPFLLCLNISPQLFYFLVSPLLKITILFSLFNLCLK